MKDELQRAINALEYYIYCFESNPSQPTSQRPDPEHIKTVVNAIKEADRLEKLVKGVF